MPSNGWNIRSIYELPPEDLLSIEPFFRAFGKYHDINGHNLECIATRPKSMFHILPFMSHDQEGLSQIDRVLVMRSKDVSGITSGESLRLDGKLYRIAGVSRPIHEAVRLDLQGIDS